MKTKSMNLQFSLNSDNFAVLESNDYCSIAEIDFLHVGVNRNQCDISKECVEKSLQSFYNKPLLCILDNSVIPALSDDFKEHAYTPQEREKYISFGTIPESSTFRFIIGKNGKTYLRAKVVIWKNYFPIVMNILKRREGNVKVSIEINVKQGEQDKDTGILRIDEFDFLGCVLLGEGIMEGIEGSHLNMLKFSYNDKDLKEANKYFLRFSHNEKSYEVPKEIKSSINQILNSYKNKGKGYTVQEITMAKRIIDEPKIGNSEVKKINKLLGEARENQNRATFDILGGEMMECWINTINEERIGDSTLENLGMEELKERIRRELDRYEYHDGSWTGKKYYVEEIYPDSKEVVIRDNETAKLYKVSYTVENGNVKVDITNRKPVHITYQNDEEEDFSDDGEETFAKKDYGTGKAIKVDKSAKAVSDTSWGSVNKTELRKQVLEAKNYKSLVKDVYADVQEGWEDAPSSKLKYPIMEIKDGKAVYNRYGLASALAYAQKNNETAVVNKVKSLYKKLNIDDENEGGERKMAKGLKEEEKDIKNKLDKDNKDVEEIRDDAEAQEDDVKEKVKKNAKGCADEGFSKTITNEIEKDDEGEEGLEDDVDADKDYWKKQAHALKIKNAEMDKELKKYKRADEERAMAAEIDKFKHCMSEEEATELKNAIKDMSMDEMKEKINAKVAEFALELKNKEEESKELKYSINPMFDFDSAKFSKKEQEDLDSIISNSHAKIKGE